MVSSIYREGHAQGTVAAGPGRARRAIFAVAKALGVGVVMALAAAGGVILHIGMPAPRRFAVAQVNNILKGTFKGKITIERVGLLHLTRIDGVDAKVFDPEGQMVLDIRGLRARFGTLTMVSSLISGKALIINIPELSINAVEAVVEENAAGELGLVRAFDSATPSTSPSTSETDVTLGAIQVHHIWAHGHMAAVPVLDADLKEFAGGLTSTSKATGIDVQHLQVIGRGLPGMNPEGLVVANATLPSDPKDPTKVKANYDGRIGDIPVKADGSLDGKVVVGVVDVPETAPTAFAALAPGQIHLGAALRAHAEVHGELPVLEPKLDAHIGAGEITASGKVTLPEGDRVDTSATAQINVKDLDVSLLEVTAPPSRLTTMIEADVVSRPDKTISGKYHVENQVGEVSGQVVPAASVRGELTEKSVRGVADVAEVGAPTNVVFALAPRPGSSSPNQLDFKVKTTVPNLNGVPRLGPIAQGRAEVSAEGSLDLDTKNITARAEGQLTGIRQNVAPKRTPARPKVKVAAADKSAKPAPASAPPLKERVNEVGISTNTKRTPTETQGQTKVASATIDPKNAPDHASDQVNGPSKSVDAAKASAQAAAPAGAPAGAQARVTAASGVPGLTPAQLSGQAMDPTQNGVQLASARLTASAEGPITAPRFKADVRGAGLAAGGFKFTSVDASASGTPTEITVAAKLVGKDKAPSVSARAHVSNGKDLLVRGADVTVDHNDVSTNATVDAIRVAGSTIDVRGAKIEGLGDPLLASARISPATMNVKAKSAGIDLERVGKLLGREEDVHGHVALDVDAASSRRGFDGHVNVDLKDLSAEGIKNGSVRVALTSAGTHLQGDISAALGDAGKISFTAMDINLGGPATEPAAWKKATGSVGIDGALDLTRLLALVPEASQPVFAASGTVAIHGKASRPSASAAPALEIEAATKGLLVIGKQQKVVNPDGSLTLGAAPWRTDGTDGVFGIKLDGATGRTDVSAKLRDKRGPLADLSAGATLPLAALIESPDKAMELTQDTPLEARIIVPLRSIEALPPALGPLPLRGEVELDGTIKGTMRAPKVALTAKGTNLRSRTAAACVPVVTVEARVGYENEKADVHVGVTREQREVMTADVNAKVNVPTVIAGGALAWDASANVALTTFPLDTASAFLEQPIGGFVTGKIAVKDLHRAASLDAALDLQKLSLDRAVFPTGKILATVKDGALTASVRIDQKDGYAEASAKAAMKWGAEVAPSPDLTQPIEAGIRAKGFRANALMPFLQGTVTELDGRIDADAKVHVQPGGKDGTMDGAVTIREGVFEVPQISERFHNLQGRVVMKPLGTVRLEEFSAEGPTGKVTASAEAVIKGLAFQSATAKVDIGKGQALPLVFDGLSLGKAYGSIATTAKMSPDGKKLDIAVNIPSFHLELPQKSGNSVQPLDPEKTVRIGLHEKQDFVAIPLTAPTEAREASDLVIHAAVKLGDDVGVKQDTTVNIQATGQPIIDIGKETRVSGQIRLTRGRLEIQGKQFVIDRGVVSFVGEDPADPQVVATAYWDAPDSIRVYADFSGRVTSGKLTLRSEPTLTQDEILALILFGSPDGTFGAAPKSGQQESTVAQGAGLAGGVVTQGLNKAISSLTTADITTRVDTSEADNPRPELAVQLSKKVSARIGYKLGVPAPGDNPDRTELTLDWRFIRNWSLSAVIGDQGSSALDVVWRLRY